MKEKYVTPDFTEESTFEVQARACLKVPGLGDPEFCGPVFLGKSDHQIGCSLNANAKSS